MISYRNLTTHSKTQNTLKSLKFDLYRHKAPFVNNMVILYNVKSLYTHLVTHKHSHTHTYTHPHSQTHTQTYTYTPLNRKIHSHTHT